jgi:hypothetical protein
VEEGEIGKYLENVNKGFCGVGGSGDRNLGGGKNNFERKLFFIFVSQLYQKNK